MKLDDIKKLHQKKYRAEFGYFLVEGEHLILELEKAANQNPALQPQSSPLQYGCDFSCAYGIGCAIGIAQHTL